MHYTTGISMFTATRITKPVTHVDTDQPRRCLASAIVQESVFQMDIAVSQMNKQLCNMIITFLKEKSYQEHGISP